MASRSILSDIKVVYCAGLAWAFLFTYSDAYAQDDSDIVTLGFDGLSEFSLDVGDFGVTLSGAAVLTCGSQLNCGAFPPFSGSNVIFDNFGSGGVITAEFDIAQTGRVSVVSARITGNRIVTMTAFSDDGAILDQKSTSGPNFFGSGLPPNELVTVSTDDEAQSISRVVVRNGGNTFTIDDFSFNNSPRRVIIDAGHGKINGQFQRPIQPPANIVEDELTLSMSAAVESALLAEGGFIVFQTRKGENAPFAPTTCVGTCKIDLIKRRQFAENLEGDALLSIHTNGAADKTANGAETFYTTGTQVSSKARTLASNVQQRIAGGLGLRDRGVKTEGWIVTNSNIVPGALAEVGFHSNSELAPGQTVTDQSRLASPTFRQQAGNEMAAGIRAYFDEIKGE